MMLRNKQTPSKFGKIVPYDNKGNVGIAVKTDQGIVWYYHSLAELNEEWEDYEEPKKHYEILAMGAVMEREDAEDEIFRNQEQREIGNYFETKEEAEKAVRKLEAWKRLKDNGFKIKGWKFTPDMKNIEGNYVKIEAEIRQILINEKDIDLLFGGEE